MVIFAFFMTLYNYPLVGILANLGQGGRGIVVCILAGFNATQHIN